MLFAVCPTLAAPAENIDEASHRADDFWQGIETAERRLMSEISDKVALTDSIFELISHDSRVSEMKRTGKDRFTFKIGAISCVYNLELREKADFGGR